ncbi:MAG: hypothetical protein MK209_10315, partial [Planctomycetes bacterium]|nr:hypothetical protein [Planctomycetota bacterium]
MVSRRAVGIRRNRSPTFDPKRLDSDGLDDLLSVNPLASTAGFSSNGVISAFSASSGDLLWRLEGSYDGNKIGNKFPPLTDLNGDGIDDLFTITSEASVFGFIRNGEASAYSGADGSLLWSKFGMADGENLGESYAQISDIDGDGTPDIAIGSAGGSTLGFSQNGYVELISGRLGFTLWRRDGLGDGMGYGAAIAKGPDVDGDGMIDVLAINDEYSGAGGLREGRIVALSARTGLPLWTLEGGLRNARLGQAVVNAGDLDGDGTDDLYVLSPDADGPWLIECGSVRAVSGASGATLWKVDGILNAERFGMVCKKPGDLNGDGTDDLVLGSPESDGFGIPGSGQITALSGSSGALIWKRTGTQYYGHLGAALEIVDDVTGDGVAEVFASSPTASPFGLVAAGSVEMISGMSGFPIWQANGPRPGSLFGTSVMLNGDIDGDGAEDVVLGSRFADSNGLQNNGTISAHSGRTGMQIWSADGDVDDNKLGDHLSSAGDINGDGVEDVITWAKDADTGGLSNNGCVRALDGLTGAEVWRYDGAVSDERMGDSLAIGEDFDRDGVDDVFVATSYSDSNGLADNGRIVALSAGVTFGLSENGGIFGGQSSVISAS